jgi:hypothetical protein
MKITQEQLKKMIGEELNSLYKEGQGHGEMSDKMRELEDKIEMLRQHAEDRSDGDSALAEKIFIQLGGNKLEKELDSLKNDSGLSEALHPSHPINEHVAAIIKIYRMQRPEDQGSIRQAIRELLSIMERMIK